MPNAEEIKRKCQENQWKRQYLTLTSTHLGQGLEPHVEIDPLLLCAALKRDIKANK